MRCRPRLPTLPGSGWPIRPATLAQALAPAREFQLAIARWGFLLAVVFAVVSWVFAGRTVRRLDSVGAAASRIRNGDILAVIPQPRGTAEIDRMCGAVSELVEQLRPKDPPPPNTPGQPPSDTVRPQGSDPRRVIW